VSALILTLTPLLPPPPEVQLREGGVHIVCCDANTALCGAQMRGGDQYADDEATCPACALIDAEGLPCGQPGCDVGEPELAGLLAELETMPPTPNRCTDQWCPGSLDTVPDPARPTQLCATCRAAAFHDTYGERGHG
jgi:hypothetical protein